MSAATAPDLVRRAVAPYRFHTVDVFTDRIHGGNQLAVLPDGRGLTTAQMQAVAREFNFSETVFVLPPSDPRHTRRLRIFTPRVELPFAGHPTIGTAYLLASLGEIATADGETQIVLEEGVGPVPVVVESRAGSCTFARLTAAQLPETGPPPPPARAIASVLSLDEADVGAGAWQPAGVSCGLPFLFVPLADVDAVRRVRLDRTQWEAHLAGWWSPHVCVFASEAGSEPPSLRVRVFVPASGIDEDPATGGAAVALAGYLATRDGRRTGRLQWTLHQGAETGRPSVLHIEADKADGLVTATRVGGAAVRVSDGTISVPAAP